jgi:RNA polymerase sigma factor (sigma-70 family)
MSPLVDEHLGFVVMLASRLRRRDVPFAELVAEGNLGLMEAARRFDPARGVRFTTYAAFWIRGFMLAYLRRTRPEDGPDVELVPNEGADPEHDFARAEEDARVRRTVDALWPSLSARERYVLKHRLYAEKPKSLRDLGRRLGISRELVRHIELELKEKLREELSDLRRAA